jgi:hypothetical protein
VRAIGYLLLAVVALSVQSVVVKSFGLQLTRLETTAAFVVFAGLRVPGAKGAALAFAVGYMADVFTGRPTWLYVFLSVFGFLCTRVLVHWVECRKAMHYSLLTAVVASLCTLLGCFLSWLTAKPNELSAWPLASLPFEALVALCSAALLWPFLCRIYPRQESTEVYIH